MSQRIIPLRDVDEERSLFGSLDRNLHLLRRLFDIDATSRGGLLKLAGDPDALEEAARVVERALDRIRAGQVEDPNEVERIFRRVEEEAETQNGSLNLQAEPRSANQARYIEAIKTAVITFGIGPAGTGKSFLAVALAVAYLRSGIYRRIVLSRPAVEAGESLGFLPRDLTAKINPYLRPLYDALHELMPRAQLKRYLEEDVIEILPLAYMRGRTLDHAMIILDEAQNCTSGQMKMALTRLGSDSKMVVTGDITQIDLPQNQASGLVQARRILDNVPGIAFVYLNKGDIVRNPVVAEIVRAYAREEEKARSTGPGWLPGAEGSRGRAAHDGPADRSPSPRGRGSSERRRS